MAITHTKDFFQVGNVTHNNQMLPVGEENEETAGLSLDEFIEESKDGSKTQTLVNGLEDFRSKKLKGQTIKLLNLSGLESFGVSPDYAYVVGKESFLSTFTENFKEFVLKIIRYIKAGIEWVMNLGKSILGMDQTNNKKEAELRTITEQVEDVKRYLISIGFPTDVLDLDSYVESFGKGFGKDRLLGMKNRKMSDEKFLKALATVEEKFVPVQDEIVKIQNKLVQNRKALRKTLDTVLRKMKQNTLTNFDTHEIRTVFQEERANFKIDRLLRTLDGISSHLYGTKSNHEQIDVTETELENFREKISELIGETKNQVNVYYDSLSGGEAKLVLSQLLGSTSKAPRKWVVGETPDILNTGSDDKDLEDIITYLTKLTSHDGKQVNDVSLSHLKQEYIGSLTLRANFVKLTAQINKELNNILITKSRVFNYYHKLHQDMVLFFDIGFEAFAKQINEDNKVKDGLVKEGLNPPPKLYSASIDGVLFRVSKPDHTFFNEWNTVMSEMGEHQVTEIRSKLKNIKRSLGI